MALHAKEEIGPLRAVNKPTERPVQLTLYHRWFFTVGLSCCIRHVWKATRKLPVATDSLGHMVVLVRLIKIGTSIISARNIAQHWPAQASPASVILRPLTPSHGIARPST